ncbi:uncharacterized protein VP01_962g2 [Puccinia sorghi]|uniref:Retrovirus-related Pol polyprotein from transposon TNT 1-94-like beta-barrel domain-containing protein n=1 Tax=Puccinia sorghi TaxID=27349 RepID=A0A0L6U6N6_9BASI|nr:uncharacterized protein VP01_962g2 [Puccinia sorghi]
MSDGKNLPVLTATNFSAWKIKVQGYCMQHGLYRFLTDPTAPSDPAKIEDWKEKRIRVTGILYQCIGETNHQRFVKTENAKDPHAIWKALTDYYESNSVQNQSLVYQDFLALTYKSSLATFLDDLDARLSSLSAVGLIVGTPEKADIKESLLAEHILSKLPPEFAAAKEILYQKRPLTVAIIREVLDTKRRDASAASNNIMVKQESALKAKSSSTKSSSERSYPQCAPGWHNPATTGHTEEECRMRRKLKPKAKAAALSQPDSDSDTSSISTGASGFFCICKALSAVVSKDTCFLDSGASHHMFSDKSKFHQYKSRSTLIELADGNTLESIGKGFVHLASKNGATIKLKALHVPDLAGTLISFGRLFAKGCNVVRTGDSTFDMVNKGSILLSAEVVGGTCNVELAENNSR